MTKKEFKENCSFHVYSSTREKHNVIYFDWKVTDEGRGYKYAIAGKVGEVTKAQLLNYLKATKYELGLLLNFGSKPEF